MKKLLTGNLGWKLLALLIAAILWVVVNQEPDVTTIASARVEFKNIPPGFDITSGVPERIQLRVHGPSGHITPSRLRDLAVVIDCSGVTRSGVYTFNLNGRHASLPEDVSVDSTMPSQIQLAFEREITREVPVAPRYAHPPRTGYRVMEFQITPPAVTVRGPESNVNALESVETDPIDLSTAAGEVEVGVLAHVPDPRVRLDGRATTLVYKATVEKISRK